MYAYKFFLSLFFVSAVLVPFFTDWGRISFFQVMILQSWFILWEAVLKVPTGAIGDYIGRKSTLVIAALLAVIGVLVYTSMPNFYVFMLGEFILALALAMMSGTDESMLYDSLVVSKREKSSKKVLGRFGTIEMIGLVIAAPIGSSIAATLGLRWTMILAAIPFSIAFLIGFTLKEPVIRKTKEGVKYLETLAKGVKHFYSHKILRILAFDSVTIAILTFFIVWLFQPRLQQLDVPIGYFGIVVAIMTSLEALVMSNFGWQEKLVGSKKRYLLLSALTAGVGFILLGLTSNALFSVILIILIGGLGIPRYVLFSNYMNKYIKSSNRATVLSTVGMFRSLGMAIAYPLVGLLTEWSFSYTFIIIGVLCVAITLLSRVKEEHPID